MPVSKNKKPKKETPKKKKVAKKTAPKKSTKKKIAKKETVTKKVSKEVKKDIKDTIDKLPGLIVEQVKFAPPTNGILDKDEKQPKEKEEKYTAPPKKEFSKPRYEDPHDKKKRSLLWLFVFTLTAIIFGMWIWNVSVFFKDTGKIKKSEAGIFENAKQTYDEIMNQEIKDEIGKELKEKDSISKEELKNSLKASLTSLFANSSSTIETTTTAVTSTLSDTSATTTIINTNTTTTQ